MTEPQPGTIRLLITEDGNGILQENGDHLLEEGQTPVLNFSED